MHVNVTRFLLAPQLQFLVVDGESGRIFPS